LDEQFSVVVDPPSAAGPYVYSEREAMRKIANILALYYLAAFYGVGIGKCDKLPLFHVSQIDDFYNKGQKKIWLEHGAVQNILKVAILLNILI
jgi:hypothetical protein